MNFHLVGAIATDVGKVREANQDSGFVGDSLFAVADGMGGHNGGEVASKIVIEAFQEKNSVSSTEELVVLAGEANATVLSQAREQNLQGMGTTLVALAMHSEDQVAVINVGDSRAYWLRDGYLAQVTRDHSFVGDLFYANEITEEEALHHPKRNVITRALGIEDHLDVDHFPLKVQDGDRFVLCSDGLTDELTEADIVQVMVDNEAPQDAADKLVEAALDAGGRDNVTVLIVDVVGGEADSDGESIISTIVGSVAEDDVSDVSTKDTPTKLDNVDEVIEPKEGADGAAGLESPVDTSTVLGSSGLRKLALGGLVLGLMLAYLVARNHAYGVWHIAETSDSKVSVLRGSADGFLWFDAQTDYVVEIDESVLTDADRSALENLQEFDSRNAAVDFVDRLSGDTSSDGDDSEAS